MDGCHGFGVCDKAVSSMDLEKERTCMETANRSVVKWAGNQILHDLVADSKIVAPTHWFTFNFSVVSAMVCGPSGPGVHPAPWGAYVGKEPIPE